MSRILILVLGVFTVAGLLVTVGYLLYEEYAFLKRKFSKARDPSAINNPFESSAHLLLAVLLVSCAVILWMERYKFDHINLENGESYPVRINRMTGDSQVLYRGAWRPAADVRNLPPLVQDLSPQDLQKLTGKCSLDSLIGAFDLTVYNGSDFTLKEITVEIVIRDSHQEDVLRRSYRIAQEHPPRQNGNYTQALDFAVGPQQTWAWKITAAKGIKG